MHPRNAMARARAASAPQPIPLARALRHNSWWCVHCMPATRRDAVLRIGMKLA
jgi:hypothetical protein